MNLQNHFELKGTLILQYFCPEINFYPNFGERSANNAALGGFWQMSAFAATPLENGTLSEQIFFLSSPAT
jgi:hypothetical protein